jgi:hypothetical protein
MGQAKRRGSFEERRAAAAMIVFQSRIPPATTLAPIAIPQAAAAPVAPVALPAAAVRSPLRRRRPLGRSSPLLAMLLAGMASSPRPANGGQPFLH